MTDADELARRYLALWTEYLTAFLADPRALETTKRWLSFTGQFAYPASGKAGKDGVTLPPLPPIFGPFGLLPMANPIAAATGERDADVDALARRIEALERRVAGLEQSTGATGKPRQTATRKSPRVSGVQ